MHYVTDMPPPDVLCLFPLPLRLQQPLEKVKTVTITLQLPHLPRRPILPPQLLCPQQSPIPRNPQYPRPRTTFHLQRHNLLIMQPMLVV